MTKVVKAPEPEKPAKKQAKTGSGGSRRQALPFVSVMEIGPTGKRRMVKRPK